MRRISSAMGAGSSRSPGPRAGLLLGLALTLGSCACPSGQGPPPGTVRTVMATAPASLSLVGKTDRNSEIIARLVTDSLVKYDAALILRPRLARSWDVSEDGLTWTFHLRRDATWHDGAPVTARDVVFTVEKVRDPRTEARSYSAAFEDLVSIEAIDPWTVRATYSDPYADALDSWTMPILPEHLAGQESDLLTSEFARRPVGCGPFRLTRVEPSREIVVDANPAYWDGRPTLNRIVFRLLPDERTAFEALLNGDIDFLPVTPDLWKEAQASARARRLARFVLWRLDVWYIGWNLDGSNPFFGDPRVRRAMVLALDRPRFVSRVLGGLARPAVGTYHPESPWFDRSLSPWPFDPAEAGRLLDAAGWTDADRDGVRERDGRPFAFTLLIHASTQEIADRIAVWVQSSLERVGVKMSIERLEWRALLDRRRAHRFEAAMASLNFSSMIPDQFELYHSSARDRGLNYGGFRDEETDRLLSEGRRTFDPQSRREIYARLQRRLHELEPLSGLFHFAAPVLHDPRLVGLTRTPLGLWTPDPGPRGWRWVDPLAEEK